MSAHPVRRIRVIVNGVEHTYRTSYFERPNHVYCYKVPAGGPGDQIMLEVETGELDGDQTAQIKSEYLGELDAGAWDYLNSACVTRAVRIIEAAVADDSPLTRPMLTDLLIDNWPPELPALQTATDARRLVDAVLLDRPDISPRLARQ